MYTSLPPRDLYDHKMEESYEYCSETLKIFVPRQKLNEVWFICWRMIETNETSTTFFGSHQIYDWKIIWESQGGLGTGEHE